LSGKGTEKKENSYNYIGDFRENRKSGQGKIKFTSGEEYEGNFVEDKY